MPEPAAIAVVQDPGAEAFGATPAGHRQIVLKQGDMFLVADVHGDICGDSDGLFVNDTRVLSSFRFLLGGLRPSLLGGSVSHDNVFFTANLTNHPLAPIGGKSTPEGVIHVERCRFLWDLRVYERIELTNFSERDTEIAFSILYAADFHDMFEVRGRRRASRGRLLAPWIDKQGVLLAYEGLDGIERTTAVAFSPAPLRITTGRAEFRISLDPGTSRELYIEIGPDLALPRRERFRSAAARARWAMRHARRKGAALRVPGRLFDDWLERSRADIALLTTQLPTGPFPYAGIPWFSTPFGRDAIITSLQMLWIDPSLARGVLAFLAKTQAHERSAFQDSAPGKIMHEARKGEMTALKEVPFGQYYGAVDTTPLFVMLAGAYAERTADYEFIAELWPSLEAAMSWVESERANDPDGFVCYRPNAAGLINQAWKDSNDSIFHADGRLAHGSIAVVEVQGYAFAAFRAMAMLAEKRRDSEAAARWRKCAEALRNAVEARFWIDELGYYAIARDGSGEACRVRASNPGHLLFCGLPARRHARHVCEQLLSPSLYSGWGIRTLATGTARYNPMSYHDGSVWPHDVAVCAAGLGRYGQRDSVTRLLSAMFEAAIHFEMRLPELFCGFPRTHGAPPIAYPVACLPQAWAAGAPFMMLQAGLGLRVDGQKREIHVDRPALPNGIDRIELRHVRVGDVSTDIVFQRVGERVVAFPRGRQASTIPLFIHV
ncbi:MAG TPA: glycogen debranching N-terminal domain-containing protein [Rhizomicrobium sp.]|jgi:glycogen debranching enzyme|nr:glycogen debranching N-terminal domain-containing protein [Rhizomicrobium sp.]